MKSWLSLLFIFFALNTFARDWNKHYRLVLSDIKSVEALKTRDISLEIRLFELYGEKLTLLIEKERDYRIEFLETGSNKKLDVLLKKQKSTLSKLDFLGNKIERRSKDKKVITKINYFRGLNYLSAKNDKKFFYYMKKAERTNTDKNIGYNIHTKLANYFYNENKYAEASKYYKKLLYDKKSPWITKHYYNLAWSELKLDRFKEGLEYLKVAHVYDGRKGYFKIGDQLTDALLLFHAYANQTKEGLVYLKKAKLDSFDNNLKFLHYVFGHGKGSDSQYVIDVLDKMNLTIDQEYQLLSKKILVYRTSKKFSTLQSTLTDFKKRIYKKEIDKVDKLIKEELVLAIKGYSGYIQELIKSERLIADKRKLTYISFIAYNFEILRQIDPSNSLEYSFFEGETYFSIDKYSKASVVYYKGLASLRKQKKRNDPYLQKTFDSLFKSLERLKTKNKSSLLASFKMYLYFYPKGKKANEIHQRILAIYKAAGDEKKMFVALKNYNKSFPTMLKVQRDFYKQVLNKYIDKKDIDSLLKLQVLVNKKFLGFSVNESRAIDKVIKQIKFSKYEDLAKTGKYDEAIAGFMSLFGAEKAKYSLKIDALRKAMFYQNKIYKYLPLSENIITAKKMMTVKDIKANHDELLFYTQNICYGDYQKSCLNVLGELKKGNMFRFTEGLENFYFKLKSLYSKDLRDDFKLATNIPNKNFVFKLLLLDDLGFKSSLFNDFYKHSEMRAVIDGEVERNVLRIFYETLDTNKVKSYLKDISILSLRRKYSMQLSSIDSLASKINFSLPKTPTAKIITEQIFVSFGQKVETDVAKIIEQINQLIKSCDPNFLPFIMSKIIYRFENEVEEFKKFIPVSNNADFEAAMNDAVVSFHRVFDGKIIEYRSLYYRSLQNTIKGSGAKKYGNDIMIKASPNSYGHMKLWQK